MSGTVTVREREENVLERENGSLGCEEDEMGI